MQWGGHTSKIRIPCQQHDVAYQKLHCSHQQGGWGGRYWCLVSKPDSHMGTGSDVNKECRQGFLHAWKIGIVHLKVCFVLLCWGSRHSSNLRMQVAFYQPTLFFILCKQCSCICYIAADKHIFCENT